MPETAVNYRSEALGAFAHEFRTPLTAIKMVMELGRRAGEDGAINLERDIAAMLAESVSNLEELADGIQALSWLERGKLTLEAGPCDLAAVVQATRASLDPALELSVSGCEGVPAFWDAERLPRILAALIETASRCGAGPVSFSASPGSGSATIVVTSGESAGDSRPINADLGFAFFAACVTLEYGDASVECERGSRYFKVTVELPS